MDFLDSLDFETNNKKSHRVRSWYMYEQYKSLEKNQLEAAQRLKERSYQDKILRQELIERKARRKLYDQFGLCQSESRLENRILNKHSSSKRETLSLCRDDLFERYSPRDDELVTQETEFGDVDSQDLSVSVCCTDDFKSFNEEKDNISGSMSVTSVVERMISNDGNDDYDESDYIRENEFTNLSLTHEFNNQINVVDATLDIANEIDTHMNAVNTTIALAQDLNKQLDVVKQDIQSLETITKIQDIDKSSEESVCFTDNCELINESFEDFNDKKTNNIIVFWSRLVSFAYQIVRLNHGNCYSDYSSQFLTAVLACDVLRRGVTRICYHLQPYVSPTKYFTDILDVCECPSKRQNTSKKSALTRESKKTYEKFRKRKSVNKYNKPKGKNYSENSWKTCYKRQSSFESEKRRASDTLNNVKSIKQWRRKSSSSSSCLCQNFMEKDVFLKCHKRTVNPMMEIARYIDRVLKETGDDLCICKMFVR